ncbi:hypothetical protein M422DRAFT_42156 [Sphaerobolus stellatus SS14]|nr:hypothetical protein M422DRAFT_42156 [Sphaerobolus stellatus SS14]
MKFSEMRYQMTKALRTIESLKANQSLGPNGHRRLSKAKKIYKTIKVRLDLMAWDIDASDISDNESDKIPWEDPCDDADVSDVEPLESEINASKNLLQMKSLSNGNDGPPKAVKEGTTVGSRSSNGLRTYSMSSSYPMQRKVNGNPAPTTISAGATGSRALFKKTNGNLEISIIESDEEPNVSQSMKDPPKRVIPDNNSLGATVLDNLLSKKAGPPEIEGRGKDTNASVKPSPATQNQPKTGPVCDNCLKHGIECEPRFTKFGKRMACKFCNRRRVHCTVGELSSPSHRRPRRKKTDVQKKLTVQTFNNDSDSDVVIISSDSDDQRKSKKKVNPIGEIQTRPLEKTTFQVQKAGVICSPTGTQEKLKKVVAKPLPESKASGSGMLLVEALILNTYFYFPPKVDSRLAPFIKLRATEQTWQSCRKLTAKYIGLPSTRTEVSGSQTINVRNASPTGLPGVFNPLSIAPGPVFYLVSGPMSIDENGNMRLSMENRGEYGNEVQI